MIAGKLPWRSVVKDENMLITLKKDFPDHPTFRKLPKELRHLYKKLMMMQGPEYVDPKDVIEAFQSAMSRKDPNKSYELPKWLVMPSAN
uniref:Uncharacterized protein n=1 Tax=Panagrolaimus sp. JU765 TaxID=591449 RepID=A0AC34R0R2_9BILA